jgi:hypothetical protein
LTLKVRILPNVTLTFVKCFNWSIHLYRQIEEHTCIRNRVGESSRERVLKYDIMKRNILFTN